MIRLWIGASVLVCLCMGCQPAGVPTGPEDEESATPASAVDFSIPSLAAGSPGAISLAALQGKVVLLDFWATWCPPCRYELPALNRLHGELNGQGLVIVGMTVDEGSVESVSPAVAKLGLAYPVGLAGEDVQALYGGIRVVPTKFLLDKEGRVVKRYEGVVPEDELKADIMALLPG